MAFILITEYNLIAANFVSEILTQAGHKTRTVDSQSEALAVYQESRADLVLVNYYLASGDGLTFLRAIKKLDPEVLVVMTTGLGNEMLAREALMAGAFDYLVKDSNYFKNLPILIDNILLKQQETQNHQADESQKFRLEAQSELAGWLDHNFKNILSAVAGSLALIDFDNPDQTQEKRREYFNDSRDSLQTAMNLLNTLSEMTETGSEEAEAIVVASVIDEAWQLLNTQLLHSPAEVFSISQETLNKLTFINAARSLPPQKVVYHDLLTIMEALIKNALEAVGQVDEPRILVRCEKEGPFLKFAVKDNGRGMDDNVSRHAFEPLFSTKGQVGVGLSLTLVKSLVNRHKGQIKLSSAPGQGTTAQFTYHVGL